MGISQSDIDALLETANTLADEVGDGGGADAPVPESAPPTEDVGVAETSELARILSIEVPLIVKLAEQRMVMSAVTALTVGSILEFEQRFDSALELIVNNKRIGFGTAVKTGENFGLRVSKIGSVDDKIKALGVG